MSRKTSAGIWALCALVLGSAVWLAGCSSDNSSGTVSAGGSYMGTFTNSSGAVGTVGFSIPTSASKSAVGGVLETATAISGTLTTPSGGTLALSGTFDSSTGALHLQTAGADYQFDGTLQADGSFKGTCVTPSGAGAFVTLRGNGTDVKVFCGTYSRCNEAGCTTPPTVIGALNVALNGNVTFAAINSPDGPVIVAGTVTVSGGDTFLDFDFNYSSSNVHASGTVSVSGNTVSGDWAVTPAGGDIGVWSGGTAQCQATR